VDWLSHSQLIIEVYDFIDGNDMSLLHSHNNPKNWIPIQATGRVTTVSLNYIRVLPIRSTGNCPMILCDWIPLLRQANEPLHPIIDPDNIHDAIPPPPQITLNDFSTDNDLWIRR